MADIDNILAQYGPRPLPDVRPREMRTPPLGQSNLLDRALSSFGQPSLDALRQGYAGKATPQEIARTFLETGPIGPFGAVRTPPRVPNPIRAYHGSPHEFDEFRLDRIGTGEGAQAYGHGMYFAENESVARGYRDRLASYENEARSIFARHGAGDIADDGWRHLARVAHGDGSERALSYAVPETRGLTAAQRQAMLDEYRSAQPGRMYEVNVHATPEEFLDWDAPLAAQNEVIRSIYNRHIAPRLNTRPVGEHLTDVRIDQGAIGAFPNAQVPEVVANPAAHVPTRGSDFYDDLARTAVNGDWANPGEFARAQATRLLTEQGIPGIRYLDQGSRNAGAGTSNYVVFNPEIIEILRKYGIAAPVAGVTTADILSQYGPPEPPE